MDIEDLQGKSIPVGKNVCKYLGDSWGWWILDRQGSLIRKVSETEVMRFYQMAKVASQRRAEEMLRYHSMPQQELIDRLYALEHRPQKKRRKIFGIF